MWWLELEYSLTFTTADACSIFILVLTMYWYLEVKIWAEDRQCSSCFLIQEMKVTETLNVLISLYHVSCDTCTVHGEGTTTRYFGSILIFRSEKDEHSIKHDRMQFFWREHFQPIVFQELNDWILEKCCMKDKICLFDHHQRSHYDTITIGLKGMINRVLQLNNSQLESSFNSLLEKHHVSNSKPTQSKPNPICDRSANVEDTESVFVVIGKTSHSQEIVGKRLQVELGSPDRTGKPVKYEDNRVMHVHDRTVKPEESSANTHSVQEFGSPEHRDNASSNVNKFNLAIDEENIDFNISGVPNAMVKRLHGINVHTSATSTSKWSSTTSSISPFQLRIKRCDYSCWEHWIMRDSRRGAEITMQSMSNVLGRWHRVLHVRTLQERWYNWKQEVHLVRAGYLLYLELFHQAGQATRSKVREEKLWRIPHCKSTPKRCRKKQIRKHSRSVYSWHEVQKDDDRVGSLWRSQPWRIRSNFVDSDTMPIRHRSDFKKALSTLHRLKKAEVKAQYENWSQSSSS